MAPARTRRGRILFLSCHLPWPPLSGGRRRELELIKRLAAEFEIHLVVISKTPEDDVANSVMLVRACREVEVFAAELGADGDGGEEPFQVARHRSRAATRRVAELLASGAVDLVHVEGFYLMQHVPESSEVPVVLVEQNIEYDLEHQRAAAESDRRFDLFSRWRRTRAAEVESWRGALRLATVTSEDRQMIEAELPGADVSLVPDGCDHIPRRSEAAPGHEPFDRPAAALIVLLANFAYAPNVDAALHLCHDVLPALRAHVPDVHTWLVGNAPPPEVLALAGEAVKVTGRVPDVLPYLDAADVIVCPLRIGGGIKVKTIEALRRGKAIVSTPIGAQGLGAQAREALLVEAEPQAFAAAVTSLIRDRDRRTQLERRALRAGARLPLWDDAAAALAAVYDELLARTSIQSLSVAAGRSG